MTLLQLVLLIIILYLCIYVLLSRVCKCIEYCATARACSKFRKNGVMVTMNDVATKINAERENAAEYVEKKTNEK